MDTLSYILQGLAYPTIIFLVGYLLRRIDKLREKVEEVKVDVAEIKAVLKAYSFPVDPKEERR